MFKPFLIAVFLSFFILNSVPVPSVSAAAASIIPTQDIGDNRPTNCIDLGKELQVRPHAGEWLAMKIQCGRMGLDDIIYYMRHMLAFFFNIVGTLGLLGIIYAGYQYIMNQGKDNKKGQTAIKNAVIGIIVAFSSFTIARVVFSFLQTT